MTIFRGFLISMICACVSMPTWAATCVNQVGKKECSGQGYYVCSKDTDCSSAKKTLPSNATDGHCVVAGRKGYKVCTATKCKDNYSVSGGRCVQGKKTTEKPATPAKPTTPTTDDIGGCTLEFKPDGNRLTKLEHVVTANQVGSCNHNDITWTDCDWSGVGDWFYNDVEAEGSFVLTSEENPPSFSKLTKVNGNSVNIADLLQTARGIIFDCDATKYSGNNFAVFECLYGYHGQNKVGTDDVLGDLYDKCVKDETKNDVAVGGKTVSVSGTVTDAATGEVLSYVNIALIDGDGKRIPNKGCTTNLEGKFTGNFDNVPDGAKIEVSFVGYKKQSFDLGQDLQIKLESAGTELNAVTVKGEFCTEEMLKTLNAVKGHKQDTDDGKAVCAPDECIDNYELRDGACVAKTDGDSTDKAPGDDGNNTPDATTPAPQIDNSKEIADAEKDYDAAYENEHSFANRMISGASMGATGLGAMQLAQGLSEQKADDAAARDMEAYMATFQCKIGNKGGKTYTGGTKDIELPGANQLTPIYQEYVDLAASVKQRKNDLGMTPDIESQVILDKANMGLYDDEGHGIENGTYASLYRASKGNEKDIAKLAEQKDSAASKVKGGTIAVAGGLAVGVAGNILNNYVGKDDDKKNDKTKSTIDKVKDKIQEKVTGSDESDTTENETPDETTSDETPGDNASVDDADKIKECVDWLNNNIGVNGPWDNHKCVRITVRINDNYHRVLTNDEAAALSPVWDWGCIEKYSDAKIYTDGTHEHEKDACETVEKTKAFIAANSNDCESYTGYVMDVIQCMPQDWLGKDDVPESEEEQPAESNIKTKADCTKKENYHHICTESDAEICGISDHAVKTWIYNGKCVPQDLKDENPCEDGYKLARKGGASQGYCVKDSKKK